MADSDRSGSTDRRSRRIHTVLVADDDEQVRSLIWEILAREGLRVLPARNGHEAIEVMQAHGAGIDVLLADVVMPRVGGRDLALKAAEIAPHIRVLFVSGYGGNDDFSADFPEASVLEKPFSPAQLVEAVKTAIRRGG
jgi:DNA-binding NtrC family response regulator